MQVSTRATKARGAGIVLRTPDKISIKGPDDMSSERST